MSVFSAITNADIFYLYHCVSFHLKVSDANPNPPTRNTLAKGKKIIRVKNKLNDSSFK